jgi:hypothetical protein
LGNSTQSGWVWVGCVIIYIIKQLIKQGSEFADVFIIGNSPQNRSITSSNKIQQVFSGKAPVGDIDISKLNYSGDRSFFAPERVTIHLRKFNLRKSKADQPFITNVPWYAVHIPKCLEDRYLLQINESK